MELHIVAQRRVEGLRGTLGGVKGRSGVDLSAGEAALLFAGSASGTRTRLPGPSLHGRC